MILFVCHIGHGGLGGLLAGGAAAAAAAYGGHCLSHGDYSGYGGQHYGGKFKRGKLGKFKHGGKFKKWK
ncbi:hypothetical protein Pint_07594 [Pistacia integerrima]|uniref:Uncharacterized protein n=2 Tax=Pistacia integerrima TaxID=434235 RepID=A0ACC0XRS6_9ROSI|nr:hypothetical protein Pint_07591 [Pistacia integerrima]KAJ0024164.1 hypothetical protein Pint_07594 [Pistacia integerrima]